MAWRTRRGGDDGSGAGLGRLAGGVEIVACPVSAMRIFLHLSAFVRIVAGAQVQDSFAPPADPPLHEPGDRIDLEPLRTPSERPVRRRIPAADEVHPEALLWRGSQEVHLDVQVLLDGVPAHAAQGGFDHPGDGGYLHAGVRTEDGNLLGAGFGRHGKHSIEYKRCDQGAVLAAAETD